MGNHPVRPDAAYPCLSSCCIFTLFPEPPRFRATPSGGRLPWLLYARAMPAPRLLILDFDGTLADSWPWFLGMLDEVTARFGHARITPDQAAHFRHLPAREIIARLGVPAWKLPRIAHFLRRAALAAPPPPLFPGIPALLAGLHADGLTLAIASSNSAPQVARSLGPALDPLIAHRVLDVGLFGKAARFRRLLRATGTPPEAALAIGDELRDIEAARAAGITAGAVAWGYAAPAALAAARPDALFATPAEIAAWCGISAPPPAGPAPPHSA